MRRDGAGLAGGVVGTAEDNAGIADGGVALAAADAGDSAVSVVQEAAADAGGLIADGITLPRNEATKSTFGEPVTPPDH